MCLIITALAALCCFIMYRIRNAKILSMLSVMYGSAALMWVVDCVFAVSEGEPFFDLSADDTCLGLTVVASGAVLAVLYSAVAALKKPRAA